MSNPVVSDGSDGTSYSLSGSIGKVGLDGESSEGGVGPLEPTVGQRALSGVFWLTLQKWAVRLFGLVTIAILTRLLSPEDFGAVAAASTVLPFFYLLADFGFAAYIVQATRADQRLLSTGFWFSCVAGLGLCGLLVMIAPLFGIIYGGSQTVPILQVLALSALVTAVSSVPSALLRRSMRFRTVAGQGTVAAVVGQVTGIAMAVNDFGAWALVGQTLASGIVGAVLAWIAARWRPSFAFSGHDFTTMARFGSKVLGVEFIAVLRAWAEAAIITTTLGIAALGYLSIAQRLVLIVQELTGGALIPVSTVAFAKVRDSYERVTHAYLRALRLTYATLSLPLVMVAVGAPLIVPILFGDGWSVSSQLAQILALAGILTVGAALDHGLFYGMGKPGLWLVYAVVVDAITVGTTAVASQWGLVSLAWAFLVVAFVATLARWFLVARILGTSVRTVIRPFNVLCVTIAGSGTVGVLTVGLTSGLQPLVAAFILGSVLLVTHVILLRLFASDVFIEANQLIGRSRLAKYVTHFNRNGSRKVRSRTADRRSSR